MSDEPEIVLRRQSAHQRLTGPVKYNGNWLSDYEVVDEDEIDRPARQQPW